MGVTSEVGLFYLPTRLVQVANTGAKEPSLPPNTSFRYRSLDGNRFRIKVLQASLLFTSTTSFLPFLLLLPAIRCPARMALEWLLACVPLDTRAILLGYPSQSSLHRSARHIAQDTELQESTYSRAHLYKVLDLRIEQAT